MESNRRGIIIIVESNTAEYIFLSLSADLYKICMYLSELVFTLPSQQHTPCVTIFTDI
jgi:hypothetical protein